jgi:hypothetical protein
MQVELGESLTSSLLDGLGVRGIYRKTTITYGVYWSRHLQWSIVPNNSYSTLVYPGIVASTTWSVKTTRKWYEVHANIKTTRKWYEVHANITVRKLVRPCVLK